MTKLSAILLAAAITAAWPAMAQTDATQPSTNAPAAPRPPRAAQFRGTIASIDTTNMVLTLKATARNPTETKVKISSTTKIKKDGEPAQFSDAVAGVRVQGSGKKGDDGVWTANTLNITTKPPAAPKAPAAAAPPAAPQ